MAVEEGTVAANRSTLSMSGRAVNSKAGTAGRIAALDFTKGILVIVMVLYHWMNYFVAGHDWIYKYLRFLPISFTFISGFLVAQVYLAKHKEEDRRVPKRLLTRGVKLLAIAALLNLAPRVVHLGVFRGKADAWSLSEFVRDYFSGIHSISFSVLVPIAYVLMLSAGLYFVRKRWRPAFHVCCAALVVFSELFEAKGIASGYLQIVSIGMLGVSVGHVSIDKINKLLKHTLLVLLAFVAYVAGISFLVDSYFLQVFGVCITLLVIYWCGMGHIEQQAAGRIAILLGQYSLFSYIIQIAILQVLRGSTRAVADTPGISIAAFAGCIIGTVVSVVALNAWRSRAPIVNAMYKAVFA